MSSPEERYRGAIERGGIADLSDRVKLRLTGADRVRYLNGQVTANVQRVTPEAGVPACVTTAKGRLCGDIFIHASSDALFVDADASLRESLPARIERYIIADDVTLEDVTEELHLIHLIGGEVPGAARANRFGRAGFDLLVPRVDFEKTWNALSASRAVLDEPLIESLRVEAGIPRWGRELDEDTLPPEAGLDRTHVDYHKGCYVGQEVISRLKSIGHVNRRLVRITAADREPLVPGWRLFAPGADQKEIGVVTSVAWSFALDRPVALGYLKRGSPTGELLARAAEESGAGRVVTTLELPLAS